MLWYLSTLPFVRAAMAYSSQLLRQYKIVAPAHHMVPNMKEGSFVASYVASYVLDAVMLSAVLHNSKQTKRNFRVNLVPYTNLVDHEP